jgi:hypothetical protein
VKKLIAMLLLTAFVCASTISSIGCGDTKTTSGKASSGGAEKKDE